MNRVQQQRPRKRVPMFDTTVEDVFRQELQRLHYHEVRFAEQLSDWKLQLHGDRVLEAVKDAQEQSAVALGRMEVLLAYLKLRKTGLGCPMLSSLEDNCRVRLQLLRREELGDLVILSAWLQWKHLAISGYLGSIELAKALERYDVVCPLNHGIEENLAHIRTVSRLLAEISAETCQNERTSLTATLPAVTTIRMVSRTTEPGGSEHPLPRAVEKFLGAA